MNDRAQLPQLGAHLRRRDGDGSDLPGLELPYFAYFVLLENERGVAVFAGSSAVAAPEAENAVLRHQESDETPANSPQSDFARTANQQDNDDLRELSEIVAMFVARPPIVSAPTRLSEGAPLKTYANVR